MGEEAEAFLHLLAPHLQHQVQPAPGLGPFRHLGVGRGLLGPQGEGRASFSGLRAAAKTRRPMARATWTAAVPKAPAAAWTRTFSPGRAWALFRAR